MINEKRPLLVITARANSSRFPQKVLRPLYGPYSILEFLIRRLKTTKNTSRMVISTGHGASNDPIEKIGLSCGVPVYRGPEENVMERVMICAREESDVEIIGRVTADNPLTDPQLIISQLNEMIKQGADYSYCKECPVGTAVDLWTMQSFQNAHASAETLNDKEHINAWTWRNTEANKILWFSPNTPENGQGISVTVDTPEEYEHVMQIIENSDDPISLTIPELIKINNRIHKGEK